MHLLTKEAVRTICRLFLEVSVALQNENEKLKIKVEQMDKDLKAMGEGREEPKRPTHILHNGKIFKIKPVGECGPSNSSLSIEFSKGKLFVWFACTDSLSSTCL